MNRCDVLDTWSDEEQRAARGPARRVGPRWIALIALANLGLFLGYCGPLQVLLPEQVQAIAGSAHKVVVLGWVTGIGAAVAMVASPVAGALSDRTTGRLGRRRPWIACGALMAAVAIAALAGQHTIAGVTASWCLAQAGLNVMQAGAAGIPDRVPAAQRGVVSAWVGIQQVAGVVVAVGLVAVVVTGHAGYLVVAALVLACAVPFLLFAPDPPVARGRRGARPAGELMGSLRVSLRHSPDFGWAWLTRFAINLGNSIAILYFLYFLRDRVRYCSLFPGQTAEDGLLILILVYTVPVVITAVAGGMISDRTGRRKRLVIVSGVVMAVPGVMLACWPTWPVTVAAAGILGLGYGVYLSVDQALVTLVLPSDRAYAKDLGILNIALSGPQVLAPAIAAPMISHLGGYPTLYLAMAAITVAGAVFVRKIRSVA